MYLHFLALTCSSIERGLLLLLSCFSRVRLCATPETAAHQAPLSLGFSRQEPWSWVPFPSPCIYSWLTLKQRFEPPGYTYTWVFSNNKYHSTIQSQGIFLNVELSNTEEPRVLRDHVNHLFILRERRRAEKKQKRLAYT